MLYLLKRIAQPEYGEDVGFVVRACTTEAAREYVRDTLLAADLTRLNDPHYAGGKRPPHLLEMDKGKAQAALVEESRACGYGHHNFEVFEVKVDPTIFQLAQTGVSSCPSLLPICHHDRSPCPRARGRGAICKMSTVGSHQGPRHHEFGAQASVQRLPHAEASATPGYHRRRDRIATHERPNHLKRTDKK